MYSQHNFLFDLWKMLMRNTVLVLNINVLYCRSDKTRLNIFWGHFFA